MATQDRSTQHDVLQDGTGPDPESDGRPEWLPVTRIDADQRRTRDEVLRRSEEILTRVGEITGVGGWELDLANSAVFWSAQTRSIIGVPPDFQPTLEAALAFYPPAARQVVTEALESSIATGAPWDLELPFIRADGTQIWVRSAGAASYGDDGRPVRLTGAFQDITARIAEREALQDANERLRLAAAGSGMGVWDWDVTADALSWDAKMFELYGTPAQTGAATVELWRRRLHPDDRSGTEQLLTDAVEGLRPFETEFRIIHDDGSVRHISGRGSLTRDAAGHVRLIGVNWDVTARVRAQQELQDSNQRLRLAAASGGMGVWEWDILSHRVDWDAKTDALYDAAQGAVHTELCPERINPEDRLAFRDAVDCALSGTAPFDIEFRVTRRCGAVHHLHARGLVTRESGGRAIRLTGISWDITSQKFAEAARSERERERLAAASLRHEQNRFRAAVEAVQGVLWTNDATGNMIGEQPGWGALTGQGIEEYLGYGWANAVHPEDAQATVDAWNLAVAERRTFVFQHRVRRHDGVWRDFSIRAIPLFDADGSTILEWVGVHTDITDQLRAEAALRDANAELEVRVAARTAELEQLARDLAKARDAAERASQAKSRFLAGMSHELRTPLNGILGYAQLLRLEGDLSPHQAARVSAMLGAGKHLLTMITSVLDMSEIEVGHITLDVAEVVLSEVAEECLDIVGADAERKKLSVGLATERRTPRKLTTDRTRLRQVLLNLLGNAVKFTAEGSVELRLRPRDGEAGLRIEVADTGPGIDGELCTRLFQDFERLNSRATATIEGSGMGLALSARLVGLLGGRIGYDDNPGGGTVFWLELPLTIAGTTPSQRGDAALASVPSMPEPEPEPPPRLRVLVVDDVEMNRAIAQGFLKSHHDVTCVDGGAEAIEAAANGDFDAILMDVRMPEIDGLEATRRIRKLGGTRGQVPIVGLTAQAFAEQVAECRRAGMDAHLSKPFSPAMLLQIINRTAANRHMAKSDGVAEAPMTASGALP